MEWNAAVGGAVIAAGASVLTLVTSKEAKISEFRQQWIDSLREDLTTVITYAFELQSSDNVDVPILKINEASTRIRLRLNPKENLSKLLIEKLAHLREAFHDPAVLLAPNAFELILPRAEDLMETGQLILRAEWKRVKRGEVVFRVTLSALGIGLLIFIAEFVHPGVIQHLMRLIRH